MFVTRPKFVSMLILGIANCPFAGLIVRVYGFSLADIALDQPPLRQRNVRSAPEGGTATDSDLGILKPSNHNFRDGAGGGRVKTVCYRRDIIALIGKTAA